MSPAEWEALLAASLDETEPPEDGDEHLDPEGSVLPPDEDLTVIEDQTGRFAAERFAEAQYLAQAETAELAGESAASEARKRGPRGPRLPGSAGLVPGMSGGPAGGFGTGQCLDLAPGSAALHGFIETAVDSGRLGAASEDEIIGLITAADRAEAAACSQACRGGGADPAASRSRLHADRLIPDAGPLPGLGRGRSEMGTGGNPADRRWGALPGP
jgi:hypothetical protein